MHIGVARVSYEAGQRELHEGDVPSAIDLFRNAATNDHDNALYRLALARALARQSNIQEARLTLLQLRESAPENAEINLDLARLAAAGGDARGAVRYYRSALYGIWPDLELDRRRREVRVELIRFLLEHNDKSAALSELLVFGGEIPDTVRDHVTAGQLFLLAGDSTRAAGEFARALRSGRNNVEALVGAGEASFQLARHDDVVRNLEAAVKRGYSGPAENLLSISKLVRTHDMLAPRTSLEERRQRLIRSVSRARDRLETCSDSLKSQHDATTSLLSALSAEAAEFEPEMTSLKIRRNPDVLRTGMNLIYRIETAANVACGKPDSLDEALILIARMHGIPEDDQPGR
ncbi:MAG: tetratricopeptide repeat protein [Acidobacteria bacterium]|nr:tetratricopeptide repeat protein [Acidobacteriota bacterium]